MSELYHYGVIGQKWGVRNYQNPDGSLTPEGERRYNEGTKAVTAFSKLHASLETQHRIYNNASKKAGGAKVVTSKENKNYYKTTLKAYEEAGRALSNKYGKQNFSSSIEKAADGKEYILTLIKDESLGKVFYSRELLTEKERE